MPHLTIEYSANLDGRIEIADLVDVIHQAALGTGVFPEGGTRTRAAGRDAYAIADCDPDNAFVHLVVRIGHGRDTETKERVVDTLFGALCTALDDVYQTSPLAISFELEEMDPVFSRKRNNIHDRLKAKKGKEQS